MYDGPKSLKDATDADLEKASEEKRDISLMHCVDTKVAVNGKDCYVYDTNVNNTHTWWVIICRQKTEHLLHILILKEKLK